VEELLARVNTTKERLSKASIILKRFRQSVLAAACSGRLTAAWREANSVHDDFVQTTVEEIVEYLGGFAYKSKTFLKRGVHQVIRIGNVRPISLILKASPAFISEHMAQQTERFKLLPDDIVISMTGTKYKKDYGYAAIVGDSDGNLFLNQRVARLRCGDRTLPKYLLYWLQTDTFRDFFFAGETGNVNQGNVGADGIRKAAIELPPLCEQHEIVRRVEAMFKLADAVEKRVGAAKVRAEKLTQAVLAKAFRGELVPTEAELTSREGRSYESASELLSRIKSETRIKGAVTKNS
jgi:type I restriction enzyme S subunit